MVTESRNSISWWWYVFEFFHLEEGTAGSVTLVMEELVV